MFIGITCKMLGCSFYTRMLVLKFFFLKVAWFNFRYLAFARRGCWNVMLFVTFMFLRNDWLTLGCWMLFACQCVLSTDAFSFKVLSAGMFSSEVSWMDVVPRGVVLISIGDLIGNGVALSCWILFTALSIFGVEIFEVKVVGMSGLFREVTIKSNLLTEV